MFNSDQPHTFYLVPKEILDELIQAVREIQAIREELNDHGKNGALGDYLPEEKAMEILDRGKTWFWEKRKTGELTGKKAAGRWYYKLSDIEKYIENGK